MTPLIVGVPSAMHREALLRETAGGGRVPTMRLRTCAPGCGRWYAPDSAHFCDSPLCPTCGRAMLWRADGDTRAILLSHPTDPEAGAMGLARLAWVAAEAEGEANAYYTARWLTASTNQGYSVDLDVPDEIRFHAAPRLGGEVRAVPALRDATSAAHAIGLVAVHLGLLDRVEVTHGR